jgi:hypothetical protein
MEILKLKLSIHEVNVHNCIGVAEIVLKAMEFMNWRRPSVEVVKDSPLNPI